MASKQTRRTDGHEVMIYGVLASQKAGFSQALFSDTQLRINYSTQESPIQETLPQNRQIAAAYRVSCACLRPMFISLQLK